jgi:transposase
MTSDKFIGIDVSKRWLEVNVDCEEATWKVGNDAVGLISLIERMKAIQPVLIVFEATGGYEARAAHALSESGLAVAVVNPTRIRRFAEAFGILAKTDKIDARVISHFANVVKPAANSLQTPLEEQLAAFVERRRQLLVELVAEKNRLSTCSACVRDEIQEHIVWIEGNYSAACTAMKGGT